MVRLQHPLHDVPSTKGEHHKQTIPSSVFRLSLLLYKELEREVTDDSLNVLSGGIYFDFGTRTLSYARPYLKTIILERKCKIYQCNKKSVDNMIM